MHRWNIGQGDLTCWPEEARDGQHLAFQSFKIEDMSYSCRHNLQSLASGGLHLTVLLETNGRHVDEASGLGGGEVTNLVHGGLAHVVELLCLGGATENGDGALVGAAADLAVDGLLGSGDGGLEELALGGEVHAVVQELDMLDQGIGYRKYQAYLGVVVSDERIAQSTDFTVHDKTLKVTGYRLVTPSTSPFRNTILTGGRSAGR